MRAGLPLVASRCGSALALLALQCMQDTGDAHKTSAVISLRLRGCLSDKPVCSRGLCSLLWHNCLDSSCWLLACTLALLKLNRRANHQLVCRG